MTQGTQLGRKGAKLSLEHSAAKPVGLIQTIERSDDYRISNALGVTVCTADSADLAFAWIDQEEAEGRDRGSLTVERVRVLEERQRVVRRPRLRAIK